MIKQVLHIALEDALEKAGFARSAAVLTEPRDAKNGEYMTSVALVLAKQTDASPKVVAEKIAEHLAHPFIKKVEIAGPGFINITLTDVALRAGIDCALEGIKIPFAFHAGKRVNIEFISANPTGDLHIGHGRGAFYGDILARVFAQAGMHVDREFYINDARGSKQIKELGKTALGKGEQYKTERLLELLKDFKTDTTDESEAGILVAERIQERNKKFIEEKLRVSFTEYYSEDKKIISSGLNKKMLARLEDDELTYEQEGALFLATTKYGDDEDRVLVRSDGTDTYFISDIAYHADKFGRGYDTVINVWGADHHGHVKRMEAVARMLEWKADFKIFITQLVSLKEDGVSKKMSKRAGNVILLEDLVDEFGIDVVRWFFAEKALTTHMEFDMALARDTSEKNPVFYVQYAHARLSSLLEKAEGKTERKTDSLFETLSARALAVMILRFPEVVETVATEYAVNKLTVYAYELAQAVSGVYRDIRVVDDEGVHASARALLSDARAVLAKTLNLLGISAPEKMQREVYETV